MMGWELCTIPGIGITGDDGGDALRRGDLAGVDHDEEFHEVVVHLATAGLHDVHVLAAHRFANLDTECERQNGN